MAASAVATRLMAARVSILGVFLGVFCLPGSAQTRMTLAQLGFRTGPNYSSAYEGQKVVVRGVVSAPAFHFLEYSLAQAIQDARNGGALKFPLTDTNLSRFRPGDELEAEGTVKVQYGMTVLEPDNITQCVDHKASSGAQAISPPGELQSMMSFRRIGANPEHQWSVNYRNSGGAGVFLTGPKDNYRVFIPRSQGQGWPDMGAVRSGDTVRITGVALQYCPVPPFNTGFQLVVANPGDIFATVQQLLLGAPGGGSRQRHHDCPAGQFLPVEPRTASARAAAAPAAHV